MTFEKTIFSALNSQPFIIAEVGINHNGNLDLAKKTIESAHNAGASAVKLQTFRAETMCLKSSPYFSLFQQCELSASEINELNIFCKNLNINLFSTVFDEWAVDTWVKLDPAFIKIASGDITHIPLIKYAASTSIPLIISTGGSNLKEIEIALDAIYSSSKQKEVYILHCVSNYPTDAKDVNLSCIKEMQNKFNLPIGFSDHTEGNAVSIAAVASGALLIEKHFTLDRSLEGPDHKLSSNPGDFKKLVDDLKIAYLSKGIKDKRVVEDSDFIKQIRRSISASINISAGTVIDRSMLVIRRPGNGIQPIDIDKLIGSKVKNDIQKDQIIDWKDIIEIG